MEADANAKAYDEVSGPQFEPGIQFIRELNLFLGNKVLDMGCGTGHLTKYIADIVGPDGQVVGVDPDAERIKIAKEKSKEVSNFQFYVGCSATRFPHDNHEPYYDVHISTYAFHWIPNDEKRVYIQKAHRCLKSGGKLAILCPAMVPNGDKLERCHFLSEEGFRNLFQEVGLFKDVVLDKIIHSYRYKSFEEFKQWFETTTHEELDLDKYADFIKERITIEDDGQVTKITPCICITACKY